MRNLFNNDFATKKPPHGGSLTGINTDVLNLDLIKNNIPQERLNVKGVPALRPPKATEVDRRGIEPPSPELSGLGVHHYPAHVFSITC